MKHQTTQKTVIFCPTQQLWEEYPSQATQQETFWLSYDQAISQAKKEQKQYKIIKATQAPPSNHKITEPCLFMIAPAEKRSFLKKLWAYQVLPAEKVFTIIWIVLSLFLLLFNQGGGSTQLIAISSALLALFVVGIAYHYWVICRPLADMQLMIDNLGIVREGAGLDHLSIKYDEIKDIKQSPLGLQVFIQSKSYIQDEHASMLLPNALTNYALMCELLQKHLANHHKYFQLVGNTQHT